MSNASKPFRPDNRPAEGVAVRDFVRPSLRASSPSTFKYKVSSMLPLFEVKDLYSGPVQTRFVLDYLCATVGGQMQYLAVLGGSQREFRKGDSVVESSVPFQMGERKFEVGQATNLEIIKLRSWKGSENIKWPRPADNARGEPVDTVSGLRFTKISLDLGEIQSGKAWRLSRKTPEATITIPKPGGTQTVKVTKMYGRVFRLPKDY